MIVYSPSIDTTMRDPSQCSTHAILQADADMYREKQEHHAKTTPL